jgi:hypothetical protein
MVISPLLRGLFGLDVNSIDKHVTLRPHLPPEWTQASIQHIRIGTGYADFVFHRSADSLSLRIDNLSTGGWHLTFAPAYSPYTDVTGASLGGAPVKFSRQQNGADWHAVIDAEIPANGANLEIAHKNFFGVSVPAPPPKLAEPSSNLKLIAETWPDNKHLRLTLSGLSGRSYRLIVSGAQYISQISGGERDGDSIRVSMPSGNGYVGSTLEIRLR